MSSDLESYLTQANARFLAGDPEGSIAVIRAALRTAPDEPRLHRALGMMMLQIGDLANGWREYEWRWRVEGAGMDLPPVPVWQGEPLFGRKLFVRGEQGLGDCIQFGRYAQHCKTRGATVVMGIREGMRPLMSTLPWVDEIVESGEVLPAGLAYAIHMLSLPRIFRTRLATIPNQVPYLRAEDHRVAQWRQRLSPWNGVLKVGLVWQGNPENLRDRERSVPLALLAPLMRLEGVQVFGLQGVDGVEQAKALPADTSFIDIRQLLPGDGQALDADGKFVDTAAAMTCLDLIVTIDSASAHLAGALGRPTWTLLCFAPDWRWLLHRADTPWYPTMRLYRQAYPGQWAPVVDRIVEDARSAARTRE